MDVVLAFPALLLAIAIVTVLGSGPDQRPDRDRHRVDPDLRPGHARVRRSPSAENDFVTASRALGESSRGDPAPADPAQLADAAHRRGHARASAAPSSRSPRCRSSASARNSPHAEWGSMIGLERNLFFSAPHLHLLPGHRHHADGARLQPARRRPARRPRSAAQPMTDADGPGRARCHVARGQPRRDRHRGARPRGQRRASASAATGRCSRSRPAHVFHTRDGVVRAVDGIDFHVDRGEIMGLVGESGCGKSVTSLSIMRLVAQPGRIESGEIMFDGQRPADALRRGDAQAPRRPHQHDLPAADVVAQPGLDGRPPDRGGPRDPPRHEGQGRARRAPSSCCEMVGIPDPERRLKAYPHEMSGGMAQRVMIAMALACEPELLIADEPTTALDVTIQAQILDLMRNLRDETGTAIILITHDLGVVAEMCDRVAVMYAGEIVEQTDVDHALPRAAPPVHAGPDRLDPGRRPRHATSWRSSRATCPTSSTCRQACRFAPRCVDARRARRHARDRASIRSSGRSAADHDVRCWLYHDVDGRPAARPGRAGERDPDRDGRAP